MIDMKKEQRIIIKFLTKLGEKPYVIHEKLIAVYGNASMSRSCVFDWSKRFKKGRESICDNERRGRPTVQTDKNVKRVRKLFESGQQMSLRMISKKLGMNRETVRKILRENITFEQKEHYFKKSENLILSDEDSIKRPEEILEEEPEEEY